MPSTDFKYFLCSLLTIIYFLPDKFVVIFKFFCFSIISIFLALISNLTNSFIKEVNDIYGNNGTNEDYLEAMMVYTHNIEELIDEDICL